MDWGELGDILKDLQTPSGRGKRLAFLKHRKELEERAKRHFASIETDKRAPKPVTKRPIGIPRANQHRVWGYELDYNSKEKNEAARKKEIADARKRLKGVEKAPNFKDLTPPKTKLKKAAQRRVATKQRTIRA